MTAHISTAVRFRPEVHRRLKAEAERRMVSVSFLVDRAVDRLLDDLPPIEDEEGQP